MNEYENQLELQTIEAEEEPSTEEKLNELIQWFSSEGMQKVNEALERIKRKE